MPSTNPPGSERPRIEPSEFELREGEPVRVDLVVGDRRLPVIVELTDGDHVEMHVADPDQAWFWTEEWLAGEREADADAAEGRLHRYEDPEDFLRSFGS